MTKVGGLHSLKKALPQVRLLPSLCRVVDQAKTGGLGWGLRFGPKELLATLGGGGADPPPPVARPRALPVSTLCSEPVNWRGLRCVRGGELQLTPSALVPWLGLVGILQGPGVERTLLNTLLL